MQSPELAVFPTNSIQAELELNIVQLELAPTSSDDLVRLAAYTRSRLPEGPITAVISRPWDIAEPGNASKPPTYSLTSLTVREKDAGSHEPLPDNPRNRLDVVIGAGEHVSPVLDETTLLRGFATALIKRRQEAQRRLWANIGLGTAVLTWGGLAIMDLVNDKIPTWPGLPVAIIGMTAFAWLRTSQPHPKELPDLTGYRSPVQLQLVGESGER